jgi:hypothetical protein
MEVRLAVQSGRQTTRKGGVSLHQIGEQRGGVSMSMTDDDEDDDDLDDQEDEGLDEDDEEES